MNMVIMNQDIPMLVQGVSALCMIICHLKFNLVIIYKIYINGTSKFETYLFLINTYFNKYHTTKL